MIACKPEGRDLNSTAPSRETACLMSPRYGKGGFIEYTVDRGAFPSESVSICGQNGYVTMVGSSTDESWDDVPDFLVELDQKER